MGPDSILVRRARPADAAALARMLARCSPRTRYERFHGVVEAIPPEYLRRCLSGDGQEARVAELATGELVGLASTGRSSRACASWACWSRIAGRAGESADCSRPG